MKTDIKKIILKNKKEYFFFDKNNIDIAGNALAKGVKIIIFKPIFNDKTNIEIAQKLRQLCSIYESLLIIHKRVDIAEITDADGIYLNKNDLTIEQAKKILHSDKFFMTNYKSSSSDMIIEE